MDPAIGDGSRSSVDGSSEPNQIQSCDICTEQSHSLIVNDSPCSHAICKDCVTMLFSQATKNEASFPPRCCHWPIPISRAKVFLDSALVQSYQRKVSEYSIPRNKRVYCSVKTCSEFISPSNIEGNIAICPECDNCTCILCKLTADHIDRDCPHNQEKEDLLDASRKLGYQACYECGEVQELASGCNHITCLCGAQFCYLCGARWKTCECKYFDDDQRVNYGDADYDEIPEDDPMADEDDDPMTQGEDDLIAHEEGDPVAQTDDGPMAQQRNSLSLLLVWAIRFLALVDFGLIVLAIFGYIDRHQARRQLVLPRVLTKLWLIVLDIFRYIERLLDRTDLVVNKVLANLAEN